jgi:hypothetical protein
MKPEWITPIENSISNVNLNDMSTEYNTEAFWVAAKAIVEPAGVDDEYHEYTNSNIDHWAITIENTFGSEWGKIASHVAMNGY